jgi:hypothetical protein
MQSKHVAAIEFTTIKLCVDGLRASYCVYSRLVPVSRASPVSNSSR